MIELTEFEQNLIQEYLDYKRAYDFMVREYVFTNDEVEYVRIEMESAESVLSYLGLI